MDKNILFYLIALMLLVGCKEGVKIDNNAAANSNTDESFRRIVTDGDYNFQTEYNGRLDTSYLDVLYKGKKIKRFGYEGKIKNEVIVDLNSDKQNELFVVVGNKKKEEVNGYYYSSGLVNEIEKRDFKENLPIQSISYSIIRGQLVEKFSIKNSEGKIEHNTSNYNLVRHDDGFALLPQGWHPSKLKKMTGQYAERDASGAGYYKVMLLEDMGEGNWKVDIKVKRNGSKEVICDFIGVGYFLDHNLIVPLNNNDPKLKGSLKIRFLDLMAAVYTSDPKDSNEMVSFCKDVGSIAGNFKKTNL